MGVYSNLMCKATGRVDRGEWAGAAVRWDPGSPAEVKRAGERCCTVGEFLLGDRRHRGHLHLF